MDKLSNSEKKEAELMLMRQPPIEDGYLHIYEIYGQNLNAELAVLSACNSGKGKVESSDGIVSLTQAFTHAGCPSVLMTLWEVDEKSTSEILALFYDNLQNGQGKSEALRNAKLSFLENTSFQYQDPYYWAGLVVIGNDTPIFTASSSYIEVFLVIFLNVILAVYTQKFLTRRKGANLTNNFNSN